MVEMKVFRRVCALTVSGLVVGGLLTGVAISTASSVPAGADTPEVFSGTASAHALQLKLFGNPLTIGESSVAADTTPSAHASGAGIALIAATQSRADSSGVNQSTAPPERCGLKLPIANVLTLDLACSQSATQTTGGAPSAVATSRIAALDVGLLKLVLNLLAPIINALVPVADQVLGNVVTTVQSIVQPVLGTTLTQLLGGLGIDPAKPVSTLITALEKATNLATIHVGETTSQVVTSGPTVIADSLAKAAEVDVLPGITATGGPLLAIIVGNAHTTSTFNRATGTSSATFDPAILTVKLLGATIPIGLGAPLTLLAGTPLESTISLGAGSSVKNADGSVGAIADGVSLDLLKGINGGISLHLAHADSAVGGRAAQVGATTTSTSTTTASMPPATGVLQAHLATTGSDAPLLPIGMVLILAGYLTNRSFRNRRAARPPR